MMPSKLRKNFHGLIHQIISVISGIFVVTTVSSLIYQRGEGDKSYSLEPFETNFGPILAQMPSDQFRDGALLAYRRRWVGSELALCRIPP